MKINLVIPHVEMCEDWVPGNCSACVFEKDEGEYFSCRIKDALDSSFRDSCPLKVGDS